MFAFIDVFKAILFNAIVQTQCNNVAYWFRRSLRILEFQILHYLAYVVNMWVVEYCILRRQLRKNDK